MRKVMEKFIKIFTDVFMAVVIIAIFFAMYNFIQLNMMDKKYVNFFGYTFFNVVTGSMEDTIHINDVILVKITDDYKENDIVTYLNNNDFITHRIIEMDGDIIITKGDANNTPDNPIDKSVILGKVIKIIPKLGIWKKVITTPKVLISIVVTIILFSFAFSYKKEAERERAKQEKNLKEKFEELLSKKKKNKTRTDDNKQHLDTLIEQINIYKEELSQEESKENLEKTEQLDLLVEKIKECKKDYDKTEQLDILVKEIKKNTNAEEKTEQLDMLVQQIREHNKVEKVSKKEEKARINKAYEEKTEELDMLVEKIKKREEDLEKTEQLDLLIEKIKKTKDVEEKTEQLDMLVQKIKDYDGGKTEVLDITTWGRGKDV